MVRIKHRYLLFNILYPSTNPNSTPTGAYNTNVNAVAPAPPSYVLFARPSPPHLTTQLLIQTIRSTIVQVFGEHGLGAAQAGLKVVYFSPSTSTCILRVPRASFRLVWASLTYLDSIPGPGPGWWASSGGKSGKTYNSSSHSNPNSTSNWNRSNTNYNANANAAATASDSGVRCVVRVVRVSGTIRKSEEEVMRRARAQIVRAKREGRSVDDAGDDGTGNTTSTSLLLDGLVNKSQSQTTRPGLPRTSSPGTSRGLMLDASQREDDGIEDFDDDQYDMTDSSG